MHSEEDRARRAAENQSLMRSVNARIADLNSAFDDFTPYGSWICECARIDCVQRVDMTIAEYEALREHAARFVVVADEEHIVARVEKVVERSDRFWIVEKVGAGADRAAELDVS